MVQHIGITGTRRGLTEVQRKMLYAYLKATFLGPHDIVFHHGDCIETDAYGHAIARELGWRIVVHPPVKPKARAFCVGDIEMELRPYLKRNDDIIEACSEIVACPKEFEGPRRGSGTWYTIKHATKQGKLVYIIFPDGSTQTINKE
jgi:hypothetical protein